MYKKFKYIIFVVILLLCGMNYVNGATEMTCKYTFSDSTVYLTQTSSGSHIVNRMGTYGSGSKTVWSGAGIATQMKSFSSCPTYAHHDGDNKYTFNETKKKGKKVTSDSPRHDFNYDTWTCTYKIDEGNTVYDVTLKQYNPGLVHMDIAQGNKKLDNKKATLFTFGFGSKTCPQFIGNISTNVTDNSGNGIPFYMDKSSAGNTKVNKVSSESYESGSEGASKTCQKDGTNCQYGVGYSDNVDKIATDKICIYENAGYCAAKCLIGDCDRSDCIAPASNGDKDFMFSSYMVFVWSGTTGLITDVFLSGASGANDSVISSRISSYRSNTVVASYMVDSFNHYNPNTISTIQTLTEKAQKGHKNENNRVISACPKWITEVNGFNAYEYESSPYTWKRDDVTLEDLDDDHSSTADEFTDYDHFNGEEGGPFFCKYNDGDLVMRVRYGHNKSKISVYFPDDPDKRNAFFSIDYGKGTDEPISWIGNYGSVESGNDGSFETRLSQQQNDAACPQEVAFDLSDGSFTICESESDCSSVEGDTNKVYGKNPKFSMGDEDESTYVEVTDCADLLGDEIFEIIKTILNIVRVIIPLLLIVLGTVDFAKATFAFKDDEMKKAQSTFGKRVVIAIIIFFVPTLINLLLDIGDSVWGWTSSSCIEKLDNTN